jgi:alpha-ketoglutaric semialdehyde dehydrogenase
MLEVRDPADVRCVVARVPAMTATEVAAAYERARAAFEGWRRVNPLDRATVLARAASLIRGRVADEAVILVRENGKTLAEAQVEVSKTADFLDYYASFARQPWGELLTDARPGTSTSVRVEPVGVVLAICPWNDPLITPARKLGPALIAGNAVVLKAASRTPSIAAWVAGLLVEAGLPAGVLQVVTGRNSEISDALLASPDAVTFTGSNEVGAYLRRALAARNVRLQAELGGKNVSVILADADLDLAFGLSAAVFTTSLTAANRFIELAVNLPTAGWDVHHPFGGFHESGSAFKEQGAPGLRFYTRIKTAAVRFAW